DRDGAFYVLEDIRRISDFTERQYPSVPHFILGHSMGSLERIRSVEPINGKMEQIRGRADQAAVKAERGRVTSLKSR
ncbi:lysophospholipase, partial [[Clostridium] symbiosum]|nr:lysophospholipase [[Clostridium] symbiosum]